MPYFEAPNDDLKRPMDVATDDELSIIYDVAIRAGLLWECECGYLNEIESAGCDGCGEGLDD